MSADEFAWARRCPIHNQHDCSPLLNGCSIVNRQMELVERINQLERQLLIVSESEAAEAGEHEQLRAENDELRALLAGDA